MRLARNLVPLQYGDASYLRWTAIEGDVRRELERLTLRLMTTGACRGEVMGHLDELCLFLGDHHLPCQWQPLSYMLFLREPNAYLPVHARHFQRLHDFLDVPIRICVEVTGEVMTVLLGHADPGICVSIYSRPSPESLERAVGRLAGDEEDDDSGGAGLLCVRRQL